MTNFSTEVWLGIIAVSGGGILAMLFSLAAVVRNQSHVHDLKVKVQSLRMEYQLQEQARKEAADRGDIELTPVAEVDEEPESRRRAA